LALLVRGKWNSKEVKLAPWSSAGIETARLENTEPERDAKIKTRSLCRITVLVAAFLLVSSSAIAAQPSASGAIKCVLDIEYDEYEPDT
jgi:hypothetical protein